MEKVLISSYKNLYDKSDVDVSLNGFLENVKNGIWQDLVLDVRVKLSKTTDKKERSKIKLVCPLVRLSGSFSGQADSDIRKHSGFIGIDLDDINNPVEVRNVIKDDPFVYSSFLSVSGTGLCLLFKIDGSRHLDAFDGIAKYLYDTYQLIIDQSGKNVSRARFVSYDPDLSLNTNSTLFKKYLPKPKAKKINKIVFVKTDFDDIISQMYDRGVNICEDYSEWLNTAYALVSKFGEKGRDYFHTLSSMSSKYNADDTDRQYNSCLSNDSNSKGKKATINSIYYHAKLAGIDTYSERTKEIVRSAASQHKSGVSSKGIQDTLYKFKKIEPSESKDIIDQVIKDNIEFESDNLIEDIVDFLGQYDLRRNLITRNIEKTGKSIDDTDINSMFLDTKVVYEKCNKDLVQNILFSNRIVSYNPIHEFFKKRDIVKEHPNLELLLKSVITNTPNHGKWITKWLVSMVASAYGKHSPLMLVFSGEIQGTGKTHWFRYLLPQELQPLFAESKMDAGKDDEILMTKKWVILDDEFGGKSKKEEKRLKEITSKAWINVREPYGRVSVDLRRLAVFCGTSNDTQLLNDPTGNRRLLPIYIKDIDHVSYNLCDKEALMMEIYSLYKDGYDYSILKSEIEELNDNTEAFKASSQEEELILGNISIGEGNFGEWLSITEIIQYLIHDTKITYLSNVRVGMTLTALGYEKKKIRIGENPMMCYYINKNVKKDNEEEPPF